MIKTIEELPIANRRVFLRVDFNVSFDPSGKMIDDTRIRAVLPTIQYALSRNAKLILASHLGRPKGERKPEFSLLPVAEHLSSLLGRDVILPEDCVGGAVKKLIQEMKSGEVILLENLRYHAEEEGNDDRFSEKLASLAEVYVNDAFGTLHRSHASTVGMVHFFQDRGIGFLIKKELDYLSRVLENPQRPLVAILGGAKVSDKLGVVEYLLTKVDALLIGGAMAYTFLAAQGIEIGKSLVDSSKLYLAEKFLNRARLLNIPILLPVDHCVAPNPQSPELAQEVVGAIPSDQMGLDIGPETIRLFSEQISHAKTILWNGPLGFYEVPPFNRGTLAVAKAIGNSSSLSVVGGGDSAAAVKAANVAQQISHISTGGGATLACLEGRVLPGLRALRVVPEAVQQVSG